MPRESHLLYFIRVPDGPVKIGRTGDVKARLQCLQCASPWKLELLGVIHGDGDDEGLWHNRYFGQRMEGEWFEWSARLAGEIAAALEAGSTRRALGIAEMAPEPHWRERLGLPMVALNHKDTHHAD